MLYTVYTYITTKYDDTLWVYGIYRDLQPSFSSCTKRCVKQSGWTQPVSVKFTTDIFIFSDDNNQTELRYYDGITPECKKTGKVHTANNTQKFSPPPNMCDPFESQLRYNSNNYTPYCIIRIQTVYRQDMHMVYMQVCHSPSVGWVGVVYLSTGCLYLNTCSATLDNHRTGGGKLFKETKRHERTHIVVHCVMCTI